MIHRTAPFNKLFIPLTDGVPCVLGTNIDGYIPIKFTPNLTYYIQGKTKE